jgi:hypothetical protein
MLQVIFNFVFSVEDDEIVECDNCGVSVHEGIQCRFLTFSHLFYKIESYVTGFNQKSGVVVVMITW